MWRLTLDTAETKVESAPSPVRVLDAFKDESPTRYFYAGLYKLLACVDGHHTSRSLPRKRVIGGFADFFAKWSQRFSGFEQIEQVLIFYFYCFKSIIYRFGWQPFNELCFR